MATVYYLSTPTQVLGNGLTMGGLVRIKTANRGMPIAFADTELARYFIASSSLASNTEVVASSSAEAQNLMRQTDKSVLLLSNKQAVVALLEDRDAFDYESHVVPRE